MDMVNFIGQLTRIVEYSFRAGVVPLFTLADIVVALPHDHVIWINCENSRRVDDNTEKDDSAVQSTALAQMVIFLQKFKEHPQYKIFMTEDDQIRAEFLSFDAMHDKCMEESIKFENFCSTYNRFFDALAFNDDGGKVDAATELPKRTTPDAAPKNGSQEADECSESEASETNPDVPGEEPKRKILSVRHRQFWPLADTTNAFFDELRQQLHGSMQRLAMTHRRKPPPPKGIVFESKRKFADLKAAHVTWTDELIIVVCGGLIVFDKRQSDITIVDHVRLIYTGLGERLLRSHDGNLYQFIMEMGFFRVYRGIIEEDIISVLREYMKMVEGLFRTIPPHTKRNETELLDAVEECRTSCYQNLKKDRQDASVSHEEACSKLLKDFKNAALWSKSSEKEEGKEDEQADPAVPSTPLPAGQNHMGAMEQNNGAAAGADAALLDGDDESRHQQSTNKGQGKGKKFTPWPLQVAGNVKQTAPRMSNTLLNGNSNLFKYFTEYCHTPMNKSKAIVMMDRAVEYKDTYPYAVVIEQPTADHNIYIGLPSSLFQAIEVPDERRTSTYVDVDRPLGDPVLAAIQEEIITALQQTFWCNKLGLEVCIYALLLAKRGLNIPQCFIMFAFGGCGLSILTDLIDTALGEFHAFFDPYIFYDDDEMRKVVESLAGRICLSAQERPQGNSRKQLLVNRVCP